MMPLRLIACMVSYVYLGESKGVKSLQAIDVMIDHLVSVRELKLYHCHYTE